MGELFVIVISSMLVSNVVLSQFLGICPFLGVSKKVETAAGMGAAVTFVITRRVESTLPERRPWRCQSEEVPEQCTAGDLRADPQPQKRTGKRHSGDLCLCRVKP